MAGAARGAEVEGGDGVFWGRQRWDSRSCGLGGVSRQVSHAHLIPSPGRGRGDSCFYQRSIEEGDGAFGRNPREIQRSQSWDDRCRLGEGGIEAEQRGAPGLGPRVSWREAWVFVIRGHEETHQISPGQRALCAL